MRISSLIVTVPIALCVAFFMWNGIPGEEARKYREDQAKFQKQKEEAIWTTENPCGFLVYKTLVDARNNVHTIVLGEEVWGMNPSGYVEKIVGDKREIWLNSQHLGDKYTANSVFCRGNH